jgi:hypothetical protein
MQLHLLKGKCDDVRPVARHAEEACWSGSLFVPPLLSFSLGVTEFGCTLLSEHEEVLGNCCCVSGTVRRGGGSFNFSYFSVLLQESEGPQTLVATT